MKVELVTEGSPECPLVRFYSSDPAEFRHFRSLTNSLGGNVERSVELGAAEGFTLLGLSGARLTNTGNNGMAEEAGGLVRWSLSPDAWQAVAELIDPLCSQTAVGSFQWLDEAGGLCSSGVSVLASVSDRGHW